MSWHAKRHPAKTYITSPFPKLVPRLFAPLRWRRAPFIVGALHTYLPACTICVCKLYQIHILRSKIGPTASRHPKMQKKKHTRGRAPPETRRNTRVWEKNAYLREPLQLHDPPLSKVPCRIGYDVRARTLENKNMREQFYP